MPEQTISMIAPHEYEELQLILDNKKPLAILSRHKQPDLYEELGNLYRGLYVIEVRPDVKAIAREYRYIKTYITLVGNRKYYSRVKYQTAMGTLLGYTRDEIKAFIGSDIAKTCECVECGGPLNDK